MIRKFVNFIRNRLSKPATPDQISPSAGKINPVTASEQDDSEAGKKKRRRRKKKPSATAETAVPLETPAEPWNPDSFQVTPEEGKSRFHDFDLAPEVMHAIADLGFQYCTPIQAESLPDTLAGHDLIGQAQTGTGKTAAFLITFLQSALVQGRARTIGAPMALVLAPTRELVMQIARDAEDLSRHTGLTIGSVYGGIDYQKQQNVLEKGLVDLVVATPGRLLDFLRNKIVRLDQIRILVIDEADRMLDMGFIPDVRKIVNATPPKEQRQTLMFSATITPEVSHLASQWTKKPVTVNVAPEQVTVDTVEQLVYLTTAKEKYTLLYNLITKNNLERVIVFTNRRDETRRLTERLKRNDISCAMLSGEVPQGKRIKTLEDFRAGKIRVLVATDVAGRGIHIDGVSHVVNYTLPYEAEDYVHRIGRTGRAGASGISVSFACEEGAFYIPEIEAYIGAKLPCTTPEPELLIEPPKGTVHVEKEQYQHKKPEYRGHGGGSRSASPRSRSGGRSTGRRPAGR
jgi:ATP-dependent RNA helicase RhlB